MTKRKISINRIIFSLILALLVFSAIFMISYYVSYSEYQRISKEQNDVLYSILGFDVRESFSGVNCKNNALELSNELDYMGSILNLLEQRFGKRDFRVLEQKKLYSVLEMEHFLYIQEQNEKCSKNISSILFFYSNEEGYSGTADSIGYILSAFKMKNPEKVMVYSLDYDLDSDVIQFLRQFYRISEPNILIINGNNTLEGVDNIHELENLIK